VILEIEVARSMQLGENSTDVWTGFVGSAGMQLDRTGPLQRNVMPKTKNKSSIAVGRKRDLRTESSEVSIFLSCLSAVNQLRYLANTYDCGELSRTQFSQESSAIVSNLNGLVSATERFDIVCPVMEFGTFSPFFWRWFNWWNDYLKELSPRQVSYLEKLAREAAPSLKSRRPQDDWLRYRHTPAFALVIT
jgi:hypothetical protein